MRRAAAIAAVLLAAPADAGRGGGVVADLGAHRIEIDSGFTGTEVLLFGVRDGGGDVVAVLRGPPDPVVVRRKQRRMGVWLNHAGMVFDDAPGYYAVASSRPLADIAPPTLFAEQRVGPENLIPAAEGGADSGRAGFRDALIRLMRAGGRYREAPRGVAFIDDRLFRATFVLPADVPPGRYRAEVLAIADGVVAARHSETLDIGKAGFGAAVSGFAHSRPLAYGLVAAIVALLAGWITGMMFRRR